MSSGKFENLNISGREKTKILWKFFVFFFLLNFTIINWKDISWVFDYNFIARGLTTFFEKKESQVLANELPTLQIIEDIKKSEFSEKEKENEKEKNFNLEKDSGVEIPKIGVKAPLVFPKGSTQNDFQKALKKGVVFYPQSVLPGERGQTIILGHSTPPNWPKINYDRVFNDLNKLNNGDLVYVYFGGEKYTFEITEKFFLNKGEEIPSSDLTNFNNSLLLISCWPPGKDLQRIIVRSVLQKE